MIIDEMPIGTPEVLAIDTEIFTQTGIADPYLDRIALVSLATKDETFVLTRDFERIRPLMENKDVLKICHNVAFDYQFLRRLGIRPRNFWDTLMVERVLKTGFRGYDNGLAAVAKRRLGVELDKSVRDTFTVEGLDERKLKYAGDDAKVLVPIYQQQLLEVAANSLGQVVDLENSLAPIVGEMKLQGVGINAAGWEPIKQREELAKKELYLKIIEQLGIDSYQLSMFEDDALDAGVNLNSSHEMLRRFRDIGIKLESTDKEDIRNYLNTHPECQILRDYQEWRRHEKALEFDYPKHIHPVTGRIHCDFNQIGTETARFSSTNPNMQQVKRDAEFRALFVAKSGHWMVTADYSQLQLRLMADVANCKKMIEAFNQGLDLHALTAENAYKVKIDKKDPRRQNGKNTNFAEIFGAYPKTLAASLNIPLSEAKKLHGSFLELYPEIEEWGNTSFSFLKEHGYLRDVFGRIRWFPQMTPETENKYRNIARNTPIQSLEATIVKIALVRLYRAGHLPVLTVHDELAIETDDYDSLPEIIEIMESAGSGIMKSIPLIVEGGIDKCWKK